MNNTENNNRTWEYKLPIIPKEHIFIGPDGLQYYRVNGSKKRIARYWSAEMVATLISLYPDNENDWIARELQVNANTLVAVAKGMKLRKSEAFNFEHRSRNGKITTGKTNINRGHFQKGCINNPTLIKKGEKLFYQPCQRLDTREYFQTQKELAESIGCTPSGILSAKKRGDCTIKGVKFSYISRRYYDKYINPKQHESKTTTTP